MHAHVKTLPNSCLLILRPDGSGYYPLAEALQHVLHSSQRSVWVDCRHVAALPAEALLLLTRCARRLWQLGGHLILCHLPEAARAALASEASEPLAASLLDAAQYGLDCPNPPLREQAVEILRLTRFFQILLKHAYPVSSAAGRALNQPQAKR